MKKIIAILLTLTMVFSITGCAAKKDNNSSTSSTTTAGENTTTTAGEDETTTAGNTEADTMGQKLVNKFNELIASETDLSEIANKLAEITEYGCEIVTYSNTAENFFNGFPNGGIKNEDFAQAVGFLPMIGSVALAGYIFEVNGDADAFKATLLENADPRWNICTEAAETVTAVSGKYVFFAMCPGEDE